MIIKEFKRMAPVNHSFKTSLHIYNKRQEVYEYEKIINNYFVIIILLESINKLFSTYFIHSVFSIVMFVLYSF